MNHIVIDLEMNKITKQIRDSYKLSSELIEIGAVKMNGAFDVVDTYQTYVSPDFGKMDEKIIPPLYSLNSASFWNCLISDMLHE